MPKVKLSFKIGGTITQIVTLPQEVVDQYSQEINNEKPDGKKLDRLLEPFIKYENVLDQLDDPEDIELKIWLEESHDV